MARIEWVHLCQTAFLDSCQRLCVIGVMNRLPVPALPIAIHQLMLAARIVDLRPAEEVEVGVCVKTPSGLTPSPNDVHCIDISNAGEYVLIALRQFPLNEEGIFHFSVSLSGGNTITLEIPLLVVSSVEEVRVH
jgi:hypothetical protein